MKLSKDKIINLDNRKEDERQGEFFKVFPLFFPRIPDKLLFHIPNGGSRHKAEAANLKRQGVKRGIADVFLSMKRGEYGGLYIEFKTNKGKQSPDQIEFQKQVEAEGYKYIIATTVDYAISEVKKYLKL